MTAMLRRVARLVPPSVREPALNAAAVWRRHEEVELITAAGAFDREFYEAQTGIAFASPESAILHYLRKGRRAGRAPHPLFDPGTAQPTKWRGRGTDPLVESLRGRFAKGCGVHLALPVAFAEPAKPGLPRWLEWVRAADDDTPVPAVGTAAGSTIGWGEFRRRSIAAAVEGRARRAEVEAVRITSQPPPVDAGLDDVPLPDPVPGAPLVSIVMPTWNRAAVLRTAVASVRAQTFTDWELVVVDDGSDDDTLLVLEGLAQRDPRVVVVAAAHGGVCAARNAGLARARGRYVAFLDSDNVWNRDFLRRAVAYMHSTGAEWAHAAMQLERDHGTSYRWLEGSYQLLLTGNYIDLNVMIARLRTVREIGGFDESLRRAVDYDLVLKLAKVAAPRLIPTIGTVYTDSEDLERISTTEPMGWNEVVRVRHVVADGPTLPLVAGRISVVVPMKGVVHDVVGLVDDLLTAAADVEVVVATAHADEGYVRGLQLLAATRPGLRLRPWPTVSLDHASLIDLGATIATGEYLVTWHPSVTPRPGWAAPLVAALDRPGVAVSQPLVLDLRDLVRSAGAVFADGDLTPAPLLGGMPPEDATAISGAALPAARSEVVAVRTDTFRRLQGFDPIYRNAAAEVDLSLRAPGTTVLVAESRVVYGNDAAGFRPDLATSVAVLRQRHRTPAGSAEIVAAAGLEIVGRRLEELEPMPADGSPAATGVLPVLRRRPAATRVAETPPRLRWALDTAAPAGEKGTAWGDTHFGGSLAAALRALGQDVHIDRREARDGAHRDLDDVVLVLRGLDLVVPRPGTLSLMWIISHPDLLTAKECATHDRVFAASIDWAARASAHWGLAIHPLLQCTDAGLFRPDAAEPDTGPELVFVGNSRKLYRTSVQYAVEGGARPAVWGHGWEDLLPPGLLQDVYYPNSRLPALYASAGAVLNDHWEDMRAEGFVSNRVFDVLACAGRLVTDEVAGLHEVIGDAAQVFRSRTEMAQLLGSDWRERFPSYEERVRTAEHIRAEHSFDARARVLLDAALEVRAARGDTR